MHIRFLTPFFTRIGIIAAIFAASGPPAAGSCLSQERSSARASAAAGPRIELAITLDDLPWVGRLPDGDSTAQAAVNRIAAVLRVHQAPATGFVVCNRAREDDAPLHTWKAWGNTLGNHSAAHRDLNRTPVDSWIRDVARCDSALAKFEDAKTPYFRFPFLHQRNTPAKRAAVQTALDEMGLKTAHVTVDNSEWILNRVHARAIATENAKLRREVGQAFVEHIVAAVKHADTVAKRKTGNSVRHILLLHANSLVADFLDPLLVALRRNNTTFISLDSALTDPVYARKDEYIGPKGLSWLYRMAPLSLDDVKWDDAEAARIRNQFANALNPESRSASPDRLSIHTLAEDAPAGLKSAILRAGTSLRMRSLMVMHQGREMAAGYYNGAGPESPANLKSVTKSLTATLVGVALRKGWISSVDDPLSRYLPDEFEAHPRKTGLTIRELLTMSTGLHPVPYGAIQQSSDWVAAQLDQPIYPEKRSKFAYDTPVLQLLSALLNKVSGMTLTELARREVFAPLGVELLHWRVDANGYELGGNDAYLSTAGMARLGELYRRGGSVDGQRILPAAFVRDATANQIMPKVERVNHKTLPVRGYGFLWWLLDVNGAEVYAALGHGGQVIAVVPDRELVVAMTSRWPAASSAEHYRHLADLLGEMVGLFSGENRG